MNTSIDFLIGFSCCSMVILLYLLNEFIKVFQEWVSILRETLEELRDE